MLKQVALSRKEGGGRVSLAEAANKGADNWRKTQSNMRKINQNDLKK